MSNVITSERRSNDNRESSTSWRDWAHSHQTGMIIALVALGLGVTIFASLWNPTPAERAILFLYQGAASQDSSGLIESGPSSSGTVEITLDGSLVSSTAGAGFVHPFELSPGEHVLTLKGQLSEPMGARIVRLGPVQTGNVILWQKVIGPEELRAGIEANFNQTRVAQRKETP